jgi:hypothetical protein
MTQPGAGSWLSATTRWGVHTTNRVMRQLQDDWGGLLDPQSILRAAYYQTGHDDFGDLPYPDSLEVACEALRREARLTPMGHVILRETLVRCVANRLRLRALKRRHPEVFQRPLRPPIVIVGPPRSGTTLLSRLLTAAPGARGIPAWQVAEPFHLGGPDGRRARGLLGLHYLHAMAPDLDMKHLMRADEPEEELGLFDSSLWLLTAWRLAYCPTYLRWLMNADTHAAYQELRDGLLWLQAEAPEAHFVLKVPNHLGFVDVILDVLPEAQLVHTHRDPRAIVASYCSLACSVHAAFSDEVRPHAFGQDGLHLWSTFAHRLHALRDARSLPMIDLAFEEVVPDPVDAARRVYAHFDRPWGAAEETALRRAHGGGHRSGPRHRYALADYGLTDDAVLRAFPPRPPWSAPTSPEQR